MFNINTKDLEQYKKNLDRVSKDAFPKAVRSTLDNMAYKTQTEYKKNIKKELTIRGGRNNIVMKSTRYERCSGTLEIDKMEADTGQQSMTYGKKTEQLRKQEFGETLIAKSKYTAKATKTSRGGSYKRTVSKERLVSRTNAKKLKDLAKYPAKGTAAQFRQVIAITHRTHQTINFIPEKETSRHKFGIFQMWDSGTVIKKDGKKHAKGKAAKLLYSFKDKTQKLHERPMLKPATDKVAPKCADIFEQEAERRIAKEISNNLRR